MCNRLHRQGKQPDMTEEEYLDSFESERPKRKEVDPDNPSKPRGISMYERNYERLKDEQKTAKCSSMEQFIVRMMDERQEVIDTATLLRGIDRKLTDVLLFIRKEFKDFKDSFEVEGGDHD